ncbi:MAG: hypothetical protein ACTSW4_08110 [Candidatus Ranarchaeia archaeon]
MASAKTSKYQIQFSDDGLPLPRPAHWSKREHRIAQIYAFLMEKSEWVSTQEINRHFKMAKRTLRSTLNSMAQEGLIRSAVSLHDSRTKLYRVA